MKRVMVLGAFVIVAATAGAVLAETCLSPYVKPRTTPEKYLYVYAVDADAKDNDFLAVVDVSLASPTFGRVLTTVDVGSAGNEPHHMGFTDDRTRIWAGTLLS
jgi:selenium-binding protein 1